VGIANNPLTSILVLFELVMTINLAPNANIAIVGKTLVMMFASNLNHLMQDEFICSRK
jgi:H+/Cl- antiporter ClcA